MFHKITLVLYNYAPITHFYLHRAGIHFVYLHNVVIFENNTVIFAYFCYRSICILSLHLHKAVIST